MKKHSTSGKSSKPSLTRTKKKAWDAFSKYIRTRDCLSSTGTPDRGTCVTCQRVYDFKNTQAGHFIAGRTNSILFDERGTNLQCYSCNVGHGGAYVEYFVWMENQYGRAVIDELRAKRHETVKFTAQDYQEIEEKYKQKLMELLTNS